MVGVKRCHERERWRCADEKDRLMDTCACEREHSGWWEEADSWKASETLVTDHSWNMGWVSNNDHVNPFKTLSFSSYSFWISHSIETVSVCFLTLLQKLLFSSDSISCCMSVCRAHRRCCVSTVKYQKHPSWIICVSCGQSIWWNPQRDLWPNCLETLVYDRLTGEIMESILGIVLSTGSGQNMRTFLSGSVSTGYSCCNNYYFIVIFIEYRKKYLLSIDSNIKSRLIACCP